MMKSSMTSKIMLGAIIAIAFLTGTITTATLADAAKPNTDGDGDGEVEGILHELTDLLNHVTYGLEAIQNAIMSVQSDITMIKSDVGDIKTETDKIQMLKDDVGAIKSESDKIQMVKDDVGAIKTETDKISDIKSETDKIQMLKEQIAAIQTQLDSTSEPLTQFETFIVFNVPMDKEDVSTIESTGPAIIQICNRLFLEFASFGIDVPPGNFPPISVFDHDCQDIGINPGEVLKIVIREHAGAEIFIRTTPSATLTINNNVIDA